MKLLINYSSIIVILSTLFFSCSDDDIMLYHPKPEIPEPTIIYLLDTVEYPAGRFGLIDRNDLAFRYTDLKMDTIETINTEFYIFKNLKNNTIAYLRMRDKDSEIPLDSLLIKLDNTGRAIYSRHTNSGRQNDSLHFTYNTEGYLIKMESFSLSGSTAKPRYTEEFTIKDGNISEIQVLNGQQAVVANYLYSYDDTEYRPVTKYAYEMPFNIHSQKSASCIMVTNLVYLSDYLGKMNKNNVTGLILNKVNQGNSTEFANISYQYTLDEEKDLVTSMKISGIVNNNQLPDDYITNYHYLEKEIVEE